jgi:hypothetical protein
MVLSKQGYNRRSGSSPVSLSACHNTVIFKLSISDCLAMSNTLSKAKLRFPWSSKPIMTEFGHCRSDFM